MRRRTVPLACRWFGHRWTLYVPGPIVCSRRGCRWHLAIPESISNAYAADPTATFVALTQIRGGV